MTDYIGKGGLTFVPNFMIDEFLKPNTPIDLVINTESFCEMSKKQVNHYLGQVKRVLGDTGILFEHQKTKVKSIPNFFKYRNEINLKTIPVLSNGEANIWANRPIFEIIDPSIKPFKSMWQTIFWTAIWWVNWRCYGRQMIRPILGNSLWSYLKTVKGITKRTTRRTSRYGKALTRT